MNKQNEQVDNLRDGDITCSTMEGSLAINGQVESIGVTTFANEACEAVEVNADYVPSSLTKPQVDLQDIKGYFARPRLILRGTVPFGVRQNLNFTTVRVPNLSSWFPQWSNRLSGAYGIRFSINFRLQIAATAFHQGLLAMAFQYGYNTTGINDNFNYCRGGQPASITNLPHVRLDLSENTMAELKVPFIHQKEFFEVTDTTLDGLGMMTLSVVLPVNSVAGLVVPSYEIYAYLTDIELFGADNHVSTTVTLQSGSFDNELKKTRILSSTLTQVGKVGKFVEKNIPGLSSVGGMTAWAADTLAGVAKYFGYSRPMIQDPVLRVVRTPYVSEGHVDIPMAGFNVGAMQCNTLTVAPEVGGTNIDEMALSFVTSQWSQICVGAVTGTNAHGTTVYASPVCPAAFWFRSATGAPHCNILFPRNTTRTTSAAIGNAFLPSSLMYIASYFRLWRGGIKFRVTFAKTKFHGGRYMISYNPSYNLKIDAFTTIASVDGPEVTGGLVQPYGYSMIMDLRDGNVFEFSVPYVMGTPYVAFCSSTGGLTITCMDPLQSSSSVTSAVPFLIEVCGDKDFEVNDFAGPWFPAMPCGTIIPQSGGEVAKVNTATTEPSQLTVGERFMSVKQMIQSPTYYRVTVAASSTIKALLYPWYIYRPSAILNNIKAIPMPVNAQITGNSTCSSLAKLYAFARGGTDHHLYPQPNANMRIAVDQSPLDGYSAYVSTMFDTGSRTNTGATPKVITHGEHPLHIRCPAFQALVRIPTTLFDSIVFPVFGLASDFLCFNGRAHVDRATVVNPTAAAVEMWYSTAAADDATLTQYIGPVPIMIPNSANTMLLDTDWYV